MDEQNTNTEVTTDQPSNDLDNAAESHTLSLDTSEPEAAVQAEEQPLGETQDQSQVEPGVHPEQTSFMSQNKIYIAAGVIGIVVITVATGVFLSMGSSNRLQGMLDKRMIEQSAVTSELPAGLSQTDTFLDVGETATLDTSIVEAEAPKGPTIKATE